VIRTARYFLPAFVLFAIFFSVAQADELLDVQKKIDKEKQEYSQTESSLNRIRADIDLLSGAVYSTESEAAEANKKVEKVRRDLAEVEEDLDKKRDQLKFAIKIRDEQIRYLYKHPGSSPVELFVASEGFSDFSQLMGMQKKVVGASKDLIAEINLEVAAVEEVRREIADAKDKLEKAAAKISSDLASLQGQLYYNYNQQDVLSSQMGQIQKNLTNLTAKQKQLIAEKLAQSNRRQTIGDEVPTSEPLPNPGFSPAYVFLTYGYPHRVGMNQYGAYGRARAGQGYKTILKAYYKNVGVGAYPVPNRIRVAGYGNISFEDNYLRGISEMPRSWPMEALKAQAVAARTYALNWLQTHPGQAICTTQACQVYRGDRTSCSSHYDRRWCNAVRATRGVVVTYGGSPITAWYASTAGGYTLSSQEVWGGGRPYAQGIKDARGSWPSTAYDKSSPWFHTFWNGKGCTGAFPWLTKTEVTDLFNATLLSQKNSSYNQYLSQNPACPGRQPGWSRSRVINKLRQLGVKDVGNLSNIFIGFNGRGHTSSVTFVSSRYPSGRTLPGGLFYAVFNLRSPGNLVLMTSLYDVTIR
jgi:SpoIID/LytB domain protein